MRPHVLGRLMRASSSGMIRLKRQRLRTRCTIRLQLSDRIFCQLSLQRSSVDAEHAGGLRQIAIAVVQHPLDVLHSTLASGCAVGEGLAPVSPWNAARIWSASTGFVKYAVAPGLTPSTAAAMLP